MKIEIVSVTPSQASAWLSTNANNNRKISTTIVNQYARDMIAGRWEITGEAIKFDTTGRLIDGQHRLTAVVMSKKTVQMAVITGLESKIMHVLDTGKARGGGDALTIAGMGENANAVAALARKIIAYQGGVNDILGAKSIRIGKECITNRDILDYVSSHDLQPFVQFAQRAMYHQVNRVFSAGEWAFVFWLLGQTDRDAAETFCLKLATLDSVSATSPIRVLFDKITRSNLLTPKQRLMATVTAWNAWRTGALLRTIHVSNMDDRIPVAV